MNPKAYSLIKALGSIHLYAGLFVSPFIVLYAVTAIMFNHQLGTDPNAYTVTGRDDGLHVTVDNSLEDLPLAQSIISQLGLHGEIDFIRRNDKSFNMPVSRPGEIDIVQVDLGSGMASVEHQHFGFWTTLAYLHSRPGPHLAAIRGNWFWIRVWRALADLTVYVLLVLTISGPAVWLALKQKTRTGLVTALSGLIAVITLILVMKG